MANLRPSAPWRNCGAIPASSGCARSSSIYWDWPLKRDSVMRFSMIRAIFQKELLDIVRDRRAMISMVVVPLVVFPLLIGGMARLIPMIAQRAEQEASTLSIAARVSTPAIREGLEKAGLKLVEKDS